MEKGPAEMYPLCWPPDGTEGSTGTQPPAKTPACSRCCILTKPGGRWLLSSPKTLGKGANLTKFTIIKRVSLTKEVTTLRTRIIPESTLNPQCLDEEPGTEHPTNIYGIKGNIND